MIGNEFEGLDAECLALCGRRVTIPMRAVVDSLKAGIVATYGDVYHTTLATAEKDIGMVADPDKRKRDSAMGNLITDAMREIGRERRPVAGDIGQPARAAATGER